MLVENMPTAVVLLHSFMTNILDEVEKSLPTLIPETLSDKTPSMKKLQL
jgi:nitrous oxidase accessory protein